MIYYIMNHSMKTGKNEEYNIRNITTTATKTEKPI